MTLTSFDLYPDLLNLDGEKDETKIIWGNSTLYVCDPKGECPRDEIFVLTNKMVQKTSDEKWKVEEEFVQKFKEINFEVNHHHVTSIV